MAERHAQRPVAVTYRRRPGDRCRTMQIAVSGGVITDGRTAAFPLAYDPLDARIVATAVDEDGNRSAMPPQGILELTRAPRERRVAWPWTMPGNVVDGYCYPKCRDRVSR